MYINGAFFIMFVFPLLLSLLQFVKGETDAESFNENNVESPLQYRSDARRRNQYFKKRRNGNEVVDDVMRDLIVGGTLADSKEYQSYAVTDPEINSGGLCGAVLIHPDILLSAAHCGDGGVFENGVVMNIGGNNIYGDDAIDSIAIADKLIHPDFDPVTLTNDVMLIKLASPSSAPISTWNTNPSIPENYDVLTIVGHGKTESGTASALLRDAIVYVVDRDVCSLAYSQSTSSTVDGDVVICAGSDDSATCSGDSGGPLFRNGVVIGVVSFGIVSQFDESCSSSIDLPSGFTRISAFSNFIADGICTLSNNPPSRCLAVEDVPQIFPVQQPTTLPPTRTPIVPPIVIPASLSPTTSPRQFIIPVPPIPPNTSNPVSYSPTLPPTLADTSIPSVSPSYVQSYPPSTIPMSTPTTLPSTNPSTYPITSSTIVHNATIGDTRSYQNSTISTEANYTKPNSNNTIQTISPIQNDASNNNNIINLRSDGFRSNKFYQSNIGYVLMGIYLLQLMVNRF